MVLSGKEIQNCWNASLFQGRRNILKKTTLGLTKKETEDIIRKQFKQLNVFQTSEIATAIKEFGSCMFE